MKTNYIKYTELLKRNECLNNLKINGFELIYKKNRFKLCCGISCLVIAIIPNGTAFFMLPLSFMLLGIGLKDIEIFKDKVKFKIWLRFNKW